MDASGKGTMTSTKTAARNLVAACNYLHEWGHGHGYFGARETMTSEQRELGDAKVVAMAALLGWDAPELAAWMDSRPGRWFGDWVVGGQARPFPAELFSLEGLAPEDYAC